MPLPSAGPNDPMFRMAEVMRRAMRTSYSMISREAVLGFELQANLEALVEVLARNKLIDLAELEKHREAVANRIAAARERTWEGPWLMMTTEADTKKPDNIVDCNARHPTCGAACCTIYRVVLTEEEVRENKILWDLAAPYALPRAPDGRCANLDPKTLRCLVWENRPHVCRRYHCQHDTQVWENFNEVIPTELVRVKARMMMQRQA
jgi:hypothetical protein